MAGCCHASLWSGGTGGHSVVVIETLTSRSLNILLNPGQLQNYLYNSWRIVLDRTWLQWFREECCALLMSCPGFWNIKITHCTITKPSIDQKRARNSGGESERSDVLVDIWTKKNTWWSTVLILQRSIEFVTKEWGWVIGIEKNNRKLRPCISYLEGGMVVQVHRISGKNATKSSMKGVTKM